MRKERLLNKREYFQVRLKDAILDNNKEKEVYYRGRIREMDEQASIIEKAIIKSSSIDEEEVGPKFILIRSIPKMTFKDGVATGDTYVNTTYLNKNHIVSITPTRSSLVFPELSFDKHFVGSKILLSSGMIITSEVQAKDLADQVSNL